MYIFKIIKQKRDSSNNE